MAITQTHKSTETYAVNLTSMVVLPLVFSLGTCGHAAGTQPYEMSAAQHEAAAAAEDVQVSQHDLLASQNEERCSAGNGHVCWRVATNPQNPTDEYVNTAAEHRALAAQHRAASQALLNAEARACIGIADDDRDISPFAHRADIQSVSRLREGKTSTKNTFSYNAGATVVFRATPGLTAEWLQRIVNCHLARNAAVGHDMPEMPYCPLVPRGAQASVRPVGDGFAVDVHSDDMAAAEEIWRRAKQLATAR